MACFLDGAKPAEINKYLKDNPDAVGMFYRYAKDRFIDKGLGQHDAIAQMAHKFNVPKRLIATALDMNKSLRPVAMEVRLRQRQTQRFLADNRRYLDNLDRSGAAKALSMVTDGVRATLLYAHGPVIPITHALDVAFSNPVLFTKSWIRAFKALSPDAVEKLMAHIEADPLHKMFLDAGAPIGRGDVLEGFHTYVGSTSKNPFVRGGQNLVNWASGAMEALKPLRFEMMKQQWLKLPEDLRTPEMAKLLAEQTAHATGSLARGEKHIIPSLARKFLLAPALTEAKLKKVLFDPVKTVDTYVKALEGKATPEARRIADIRSRRAGIYLGVLAGLITANQAILKAGGSSERVNYTDPTRGDYMALKFAGHSMKLRGAVEVLSLLAKLSTIGTTHRQTTYESARGTAGDTLMKYAEGKFTPAVGAAIEGVTGKDYLGRPLPWSSNEEKPGSPRLTYPEYAASKGPIFMGAGVKAAYEAMREHGADHNITQALFRTISERPGDVLKAFASEAGPEFFGFPVKKDYAGEKHGTAKINYPFASKQ